MYPPKSPLGKKTPNLWHLLTKVRRNALELIPQAATEDAFISGKTASQPWHMLMEPSMLAHVTDTNYTNYPRSDLIKSVLRPAIGNGFFLSEGDRWLWQRRAAAPALGKRFIERLRPSITDTAEQLCHRLSQNGSQPLNIYAEAIGATFDLVCRALFSDVDAVNREAMESAFSNYVSSSIGSSMLQAVGLPKWISKILPTNNPAQKMHDVLEQIIEDRKTNGPLDKPDMLDQLLAARHPNSSAPMDTTDLRDNLLTFMIAGHDTTALTLAWALYLCAYDTSVQNDLRNEANSQLAWINSTNVDPNALPFSEKVVSETLRLYPPAAISSRTAQADDILGPLNIKKGDLVLLPTYALHRHKQYWEAPDAFRPQRFEKNKTLDQLIYMPFGNGPRSCIGAQLATTEIKIILSTLVSRFQFSTVVDRIPQPVLKLTLHPKDGIFLNVSAVTQ